MTEYCSNCGGELGFAATLLEWLRGEPNAVFIKDIYDRYPGLTEKQIRKVLASLKKKEFVLQPMRGYYSA